MHRPRRLRQREALRALVRETRLSAEQLVMPLFVRAGKNIRAPIPSIPGQFQLSVDQLVRECRALAEQRVPAVLLFGLSAKKDERASRAYAKDGLIQQAVQTLKAERVPILVITDVCLCAYMSHGHCGVVKFAEGRRPRPKGKAENVLGLRPPASGHSPKASIGSTTTRALSYWPGRRCRTRRRAPIWWRPRT